MVCLPVEAPGLTESWNDVTPVQQAEQRPEAPRDRAEGKPEQICKLVARQSVVRTVVHIVDNSKTGVGIGEIAARIE
jgi:hypothetical protein